MLKKKYVENTQTNSQPVETEQDTAAERSIERGIDRKACLPSSLLCQLKKRSSQNKKLSSSSRRTKKKESLSWTSAFLSDGEI